MKGDVAAGGVSERVAPHCALPCRSAVLASRGHDALPLAISHNTSLSLPQRWLARAPCRRACGRCECCACSRRASSRASSSTSSSRTRACTRRAPPASTGAKRSTDTSRAATRRRCREVAAIERFLLETDFLNARANTSREADFPSAWREYTEVFGDPRVRATPSSAASRSSGSRRRRPKPSTSRSRAAATAERRVHRRVEGGDAVLARESSASADGRLLAQAPRVPVPKPRRRGRGVRRRQSDRRRAEGER